MAGMTTRERFARVYQHRPADRVPIIDIAWDSTVERWHREGMPADIDWADYFGLDRVVAVGGDNSPRYPWRLIEETEDYAIAFDSWGTTSKNWKHVSSTPHYMARTIVDRATWQDARSRMVMSPDRIPWDHFKNNYKAWREKGWWIEGALWFGFDVSHARAVGTEKFLSWTIDEPELVVDIVEHELTCSLQLLDMIWDAGYTFDCVSWPDDMGYRNGTFFSLDTYRRLIKPAQKRAIEWAHARGLPARMHSCGNINAFLPDLVEIGLDALNPLEVKAGMDPLQVKRDFGDKLVLHGGLNAMLWDDIDKIEAEMRRLVTVLKVGGGYICSSDHSVPSSVSLANFRRIVELAKELGAY